MPPKNQIFYFLLDNMINYNMTSIKLTANDIHTLVVFTSQLINHVKAKSIMQITGFRTSL
jgi:hypothetical protein